jgi:rRNA-processing protein FCF1
MKPLPTIILLDTNVLYHSLDYGIKIEEAVDRVINRDYVIMVHTKVQEEIIRDLSLDTKRGRIAKFAVELMTQFENFEDDREYPGADTALVQTAQRTKGVVFTYDKALRDRCKELLIPVLTFHYKGNVQLIGYIP